MRRDNPYTLKPELHCKRGHTLEQFEGIEGGKTMLKKVGRPREVAHAILFLASDEASYGGVSLGGWGQDGNELTRFRCGASSPALPTLDHPRFARLIHQEPAHAEFE